MESIIAFLLFIIVGIGALIKMLHKTILTQKSGYNELKKKVERSNRFNTMSIMIGMFGLILTIWTIFQSCSSESSLPNTTQGGKMEYILIIVMFFLLIAIVSIGAVFKMLHEKLSTILATQKIDELKNEIKWVIIIAIISIILAIIGLLYEILDSRVAPL